MRGLTVDEGATESRKCFGPAVASIGEGGRRADHAGEAAREEESRLKLTLRASVSRVSERTGFVNTFYLHFCS